MRTGITICIIRQDNLMEKFAKKRILVTGGGSGLGRAICLGFAVKGWKICIAEINIERAEETAELVEKKGGTALTVKCDVTSEEDLKSAAEKVREAWGGIDILVNNAGIATAGYMEKISAEQWDRIIDVNLKSVITSCRVFIPVIAAQGGGHIVNVASNAGIACLPEMSCYNVTKAGVIALSETLKSELSPKKIGVTVVAPTFFKTNLLESFSSTDERQKKMAETFFKRSLCSAEDVAADIIRSVFKNKLYVITQLDGKLVWYLKRLAPSLFFKTLAFGQRTGISGRIMGM